MLLARDCSKKEYVLAKCASVTQIILSCEKILES